MSAKLKRQIKEHIDEEPLSLEEIAENFDITEKKAFRLLRSLFKKGEISSFKADDGQRKYKLAKDW
jgi:DNA-binding IscR family transcriptional regulator